MAKSKKVQSKPTVSAEAVKPAETDKAVEIVKPAEEVKAAPAEKKAEVPAAEKKIEKTAAAKKTAKPAAEKKAEKPAAKKAESAKKDIFLIQGAGEHTVSEVTELCKAAYRNGTRKQIKNIDVYVKAENGELRAYYVVNGDPECRGSIVL